MMSLWRAARTAVGWRAAQQAGVQAIYFARLLILARLLAPDTFGVLAIALLALAVLMSLSDVGVVPALVQRDREDRDEYDAAWTLRILRAGAVAATLTIVAPFIAALFDEPRATSVIRVLAMKPLIEAMGSIGIVRLTRTLRFRDLAVLYVGGATVDAGVAVVLAAALGVWALVIGALSGAAAVTLLSYAMAPHRPRLLFDVTRVAPLVNFGRWMLGMSVVGLIASSGVQMLISRRLGSSALGLYFLATKIAFLPADAASAVVGSVAFPFYSSVRGDGQVTTRAFRSVLSAQALVLIPLYVLMLVLAPSLADALGPAWGGTAPLIQMVGLAALVGGYADSALPLLIGRGRPDRAMWIVSAQTAVLLAVVVPLISAGGARGAALAWLPAHVAALITSVAFVQREIGPPLAATGTRLLGLGLVASVAGCTAALAQVWLTGITALVAGTTVGGLTIVALVALLSRRLDFGIQELLSGRAAQAA